MQSSFTRIQLNNAQFKLLTTSSLQTRVLTKSTTNNDNIQRVLLPSLYHQFIYIVKYTSFDIHPSQIVDLLTEQTVESSRVRVTLLRHIASKLNIDPLTLRLNWIEKLGHNDLVDNSSLNEDYDLKQQKDIVDYDDYMNSDVILHPRSSFILISLSSWPLLEMQTAYLHNHENQATINSRSNKRIESLYKRKCTDFFSQMRYKHQIKLRNLHRQVNRIPFDIGLRQLLAHYLRTTRSHGIVNENIHSVKLFELCDLKELYKVLSSPETITNSDDNTFKTSNQYRRTVTTDFIRNNTFEFNFDHFNSRINDDNDLKQVNNKAEVNFKSFEQQPTSITQTITIISPKEEKDAGTLIQSDSKKPFNLTTWFFSIIPEENFLMAVVIPVIIIIAVLILTIVVICTFHIATKMYRLKKSKKAEQKHQTQHLLSSNMINNNNNNSPPSNTVTTVVKSTSASSTTGSSVISNIQNGTKSITLSTSSSSSNPNHIAANSTLPLQLSQNVTNNTNAILKQRAYLSKGVPVILYEEMSHKPIDDYDENRRDIMMDSGDEMNISSFSDNNTNNNINANSYRYQLNKTQFYNSYQSNNLNLNNGYHHKRAFDKQQSQLQTPPPPEYSKRRTDSSRIKPTSDSLLTTTTTTSNKINNNINNINSKNELLEFYKTTLLRRANLNDNVNQLILKQNSNNKVNNNIYYDPPQPIIPFTGQISNFNDIKYNKNGGIDNNNNNNKNDLLC
jgi:hypothetical protein